MGAPHRTSSARDLPDRPDPQLDASGRLRQDPQGVPGQRQPDRVLQHASGSTSSQSNLTSTRALRPDRPGGARPPPNAARTRPPDVGRYIVRRLIATIPVLFGLSIILFAFIHLLPGDPAAAILGQHATPELVAEIRAELGLDKPLWQQYVDYMGKLVQGDFGKSIINNRPIVDEFLRRFPGTIELDRGRAAVRGGARHPAGPVRRPPRAGLRRRPGHRHQPARDLDPDLRPRADAAVHLRRAAQDPARRGPPGPTPGDRVPHELRADRHAARGGYHLPSSTGSST